MFECSGRRVMVELVTTPLGWIFLGGLLVIALGLLGRWRNGPAEEPGTGRLWAGLWLLLMLLSTPLTARLLTISLDPADPESSPAWLEMEGPEVVVVLGGGLDGPSVPGCPLSASSRERLHAALGLARSWPQAALLMSAGSPASGHVTTGARMAEEALRLGVEPERVHVEARSQTTRDNALFVADYLGERRWSRVVLVTSRLHMRRAMAAFAAEGMAPVPMPASPRMPWRFRPVELLPSASALAESTSAIHDWIGLGWYRLRGWTAPVIEPGGAETTKPAEGAGS